MRGNFDATGKVVVMWP